MGFNYFLRRILAAGVDFLILLFPSYATTFFLIDVLPHRIGLEFIFSDLDNYVANWMPFLIMLLFVAFCEYRFSTTIGKRIMGLRVTSVVDSRIYYLQTLVRNLPIFIIQCLSISAFLYSKGQEFTLIYVIFNYSIVLCIILLATYTNGQNVGDIWARTRVVSIKN